jgi:hypothetical protein
MLQVPRPLAILARPLCLLIGHRRVERLGIGEDHYISHCALCRRDIVKRGQEPWRLPRSGKRIVWEEARKRHR